MAKSYNHLKDMIENQKKKPKVRKNSECIFCECTVCELRLMTLQDIPMVICKKCYQERKDK